MNLFLESILLGVMIFFVLIGAEYLDPYPIDRCPECNALTVEEDIYLVCPNGHTGMSRNPKYVK